VAPTEPSQLRLALARYTAARQSAMKDAQRRLGLNEMDARALLFIADNPGTRPTGLREYLGITSAGVTTLIDRLVQHGAVRRDLDQDDRRVNHITATVDLYAEPWSALTRFDTRFDDVLSRGDAGELQRFADSLDAVTGEVGAAPETPSAG
jgi:DNA-binding MarR family transcriptional regulator